MTPLFSSRMPERGIQEAAWVARCVGDSETAPLREADLSVLAAYIRPIDLERGAPIFRAGEPPAGAWIMRSGMAELVVGSGKRRAVVRLLWPGDVDGDLQLILGMDMPYSARALERCRLLFIQADSFEKLLAEHPAIARRWLSSVAARVSAGQARIMQLLGRSLPEQLARLLVDESDDDVVPLPQRTLAAMLGVQRPSLNKVLRHLEADGLVDLGYGEVRVLDRRRLERLAEKGK